MTVIRPWFIVVIMEFGRWLLALLVLASSSLVQAAKSPLKVATLEWPPFVCTSCPQQGAAAMVLEEVLSEAGISIQLEFLPWTRALRLGKHTDFLGTYPIWPEEGSADRLGFYKTISLYKSPVGIIYPAGKKIKWRKVKDLAGYRFGLVQDYGLSQNVQKMVDKGSFKIVPSIDEITNIRKVAAGRVDFAIIDLHVIQYHLKNELRELKDKIEVDERILEIKTHHLAVNSENRKSVLKINEAIKKVRTQEILNQYLSHEMNIKPLISP